MKQAKEELNRKKEFIQSLKTVKEVKNSETDELRREIDNLKEEIEKLKKQNKELLRKEQSYKEFKDKFDNMKQIEKNLQDEKSQNLEKIKALKSELNRKDAALKDMRDKIELMTIQDETKKLNEDEVEKGKETIKKLRAELERKEYSLKTLKSKLDSVILELDQVKGECLNRTQDISSEIEKEMKKHEQTKIILKNIESQYQNLVFILRRLYRDTFITIQKLKGKINLVKHDTQRSENYYKFSESLDILNLTPDEIQLFVDPKVMTTDTSFATNKQIEKFEDELSKVSGINPSNVYDMISSLIEERVHAEKNN